MALTLEEAMASVWRQALVDKAKSVELAGRAYPVRATAKRGLRQVDFVFEGEELRGLEQNPKTQSRWAQLARAGKKVMQFLQQGRYVGVVVDGKVTLYGKPSGNRAAAGH
jgi:NADPH-dependent ferric siderophore reductase